MSKLTSYETAGADGLVATKEIRRFKVAINTACPLRCEYCFIDKDSGEVIGWDQVQGLVRFFLGSPGPVKKLLIYGEPFLKFDLAGTSPCTRGPGRPRRKDLDLSSAPAASRPRPAGISARPALFPVGQHGRRRGHP